MGWALLVVCPHSSVTKIIRGVSYPGFPQEKDDKEERVP